MKILSFDTATDACSAALSIDGEIIQEFQIAPQKHAELLLPMIDCLLQDVGIRRREIDAVAFGCGPGSFMGVRIATGIAQGIAYGIQCPVIPISTLRALAQTAYEKLETTHALVGWDARMNEVYWGAYELGEHQLMVPVQEDHLSAPENLTFTSELSWFAVGNAWEIYKNQFKSLEMPKLTVVSQEIYPTAEAIAKIAIQAFQESHPVLSPLEVEPTYLRNKVARKPSLPDKI